VNAVKKTGFREKARLSTAETQILFQLLLPQKTCCDTKSKTIVLRLFRANDFVMEIIPFVKKIIIYPEVTLFL
jgi:hypothetical protein